MSQMNELQKNNELTSNQQKIESAHNFLLEFLDSFNRAKRGGIHDFIEISMYNMVNSAIKNIDDYLQTGHKSVDGSEIIHITVDSFQKVLDGMKRNLEGTKQVNFR
jgi:hypothetical protein